MIERRAVEAGLLYSAAVFIAGFVLGALRVLYLAPLAGELIAVALEAPVMLAIAWGACGWASERQEVSPRLLDRLVMGAVALATLLAAEVAVAVLAERRSVPEFLASYSRPALLLGIAAQLAFAFFPLFNRRRRD
jgi:hypothetical protein